jgi:hypothetical protein
MWPRSTGLAAAAHAEGDYGPNGLAALHLVIVSPRNSCASRRHERPSSFRHIRASKIDTFVSQKSQVGSGSRLQDGLFAVNVPDLLWGTCAIGRLRAHEDNRDSRLSLLSAALCSSRLQAAAAPRAPATSRRFEAPQVKKETTSTRRWGRKERLT